MLFAGGNGSLLRWGFNKGQHENPSDQRVAPQRQQDNLGVSNTFENISKWQAIVQLGFRTL